MGFKFSGASQEQLRTCHPIWWQIGAKAIMRTPIDFAVIQGFRSDEAQETAFLMGNSDLRAGESKHNHRHNGKPCSLAIDIIPVIRGKRTFDHLHAYGVIFGVMYSCAHEMGHTLRWGADWNMDGDVSEHKLKDFGHIELVGAF